MPTQKQSGSSITRIDDHIIDISKLDKDDMNAILRHKGKIPLSKEERAFLEAIHGNLLSSTIILQNTITLIMDNQNMPDDQKKEVVSDINMMIDDNNHLLSIPIKDIGCGYTFKQEEK